jgi:hypothetical protein
MNPLALLEENKFILANQEENWLMNALSAS